MKTELNYTSPPTSKAIAQLGIKWKASMYWQLIPGAKKYILKNKLEPFKIGFPAYNMSELGHIIPFGFLNEMKVLKLINTYFQVQLETDNWQTYASEVEARAHYLIYLFRSGKVTLQTIEKTADRVQISPSLPLPTKP
jgi:hypothetical protein